MKPLKESSRARGGTRGGCGGGWEQTNPDYQLKHLRQLRKDYLAMDPKWRATFLAGLSRYEQKVARGQIAI